ncbi:MAG TPA: preprotein translocase subunit SecG [Polyangiaceae bacterium]|nr:preprotein translocase subunit SecG [Polyangiaceae bacterium]
MLEILETPLTVLHIGACLILVLVVLIQPGKSGGLGAFGGASAQQVFGGRGAGNFLTKATWITAGTFFVTSISLAYLSSSTTDSLEAKSKKTEQVGAPAEPAKPSK